MTQKVVIDPCRRLMTRTLSKVFCLKVSSRVIWASPFYQCLIMSRNLMTETLVLYYLPFLRLYCQGDCPLGVHELRWILYSFSQCCCLFKGVRDSCLEGCDFWLLPCVQLVSHFGFSDLPLSVVPGNLLPRGPRQLGVTVESFPVCVHRVYLGLQRF